MSNSHSDTRSPAEIARDRREEIEAILSRLNAQLDAAIAYDATGAWIIGEFIRTFESELKDLRR